MHGNTASAQCWRRERLYPGIPVGGPCDHVSVIRVQTSWPHLRLGRQSLTLAAARWKVPSEQPGSQSSWAPIPRPRATRSVQTLQCIFPT